MPPLFQAKGQHLELTLPSSPTRLYGDRRQLERALLNLLSNAQKYSPSGADVQLSVAAHGDDVAWSVGPGPGITDADRARLFERFFTVATDASSDGPAPVSGCRSRERSLGRTVGRSRWRAAVGRGSTFTLRVPLSGPREEAEP